MIDWRRIARGLLFGSLLALAIELAKWLDEIASDRPTEDA